MGVVLLTNESLQSALQSERVAGRSIVTTNGCFDILNYAHVKMLEAAKKQADVLVVGVNSDHSIRELKGPSRPIRCEQERLALVAALEVVDYAVPFDERDCVDFVARVRPDVHVNDASYGENCIEAEIVRAGGGRLHLLEKFEWESNTELLERLRRMFADGKLEPRN